MVCPRGHELMGCGVLCFVGPAVLKFVYFQRIVS
nr:MAG TPA: hypothetical protein [Bacteriophage sp.]